jgi:hypothetical protein
MNLLAVFAWEMLGFFFLAFLERTVEGEHGGAEATYGWRKSVLGYSLKEYHFWLWYVVVPIFVLSPLVAYGFDTHLLGTVADAYLLGGILEDFTYFAVNPYYGLKKWNRAGAPWMSWVSVRGFEVPVFYLRNAAAALVLWLLLVK